MPDSSRCCWPALGLVNFVNGDAAWSEGLLPPRAVVCNAGVHSLVAVGRQGIADRIPCVRSGGHSYRQHGPPQHRLSEEMA